MACKERVRLILVFLSPSLDLATNKWHALSLMFIDTSKMVSNNVFSRQGVLGIISKFKCQNETLKLFLNIYYFCKTSFMQYFLIWGWIFAFVPWISRHSAEYLTRILHAMSQLSGKLHALLCEDRSFTLYFWEDEC